MQQTSSILFSLPRMVSGYHSWESGNACGTILDEPKHAFHRLVLQREGARRAGMITACGGVVVVGHRLAEGGSERVRQMVEPQECEPSWGGAHGKIPP